MFKRAGKELAKQAIHTEDYNEEIELTEERLAGVFSGSEDESDESDDELVIPANFGREKYLKAEIDADESEDNASDDNGSDIELNDEEEEESENEIEGEESGPVIYSCKICPNKHLKVERQVEIHLKSKEHNRRLRFLRKHGLESDDEMTEQQKARLEKSKEKKEEIKKQRKSKAHQKVKDHRKELKRKRWELQQAEKAAEEKLKAEAETKKEIKPKAPAFKKAKITKTTTVKKATLKNTKAKK
ncbi:hypothetical protein J3Q64DRAFT_1822245 [Phycomyces blakesleeanus]|uniref:C2H2-type zinc finger transcription factor n=1 Tax=Phycomyces blakesleeanus TaxID=4837 RepID=A0ABR3B138_PHYBL